MCMYLYMHISYTHIYIYIYIYISPKRVSGRPGEHVACAHGVTNPGVCGTRVLTSGADRGMQSTMVYRDKLWQW